MAKPKKTLNDYLALGQKKGVEFLDKEIPPTTHTKVRWRCLSCGYLWAVSFQSIQSGRGCPNCAKRLPQSEQEYKRVSKQHGLIWLGNSLPTTSSEPTKFQCRQCGYEWLSNLQYLRSGYGCPICGRERAAAKNRKGSDDYHVLAARLNLTWLGPIVRNVRTKTNWICNKGHKIYVSFHGLDHTRWANGKPCKQCFLEGWGFSRRLTENDYQLIANKKGVDWIGVLPNSYQSHTLWRCRCGNAWMTSYANIKRSKNIAKCPKCRHIDLTQQKKLSSNDYEKLAIEKECVWKGEELPPNSAGPTLWQSIKCGHVFQASYQTLKKVSHCPICRKGGVKFLEDYIQLASQKRLYWSGKSLPKSANTSTTWICQVCRNEFSATYWSIRQGRRCPFCTHYENGRPVSVPQENLKKLIENTFPNVSTRHNEIAEGCSIDISFVYQETKFATFFDGWYWHNNQVARARDLTVNERLTAADWKVLRVVSNSQLPISSQIADAINRLLLGEQLIYILLISER